MRSEEKNNQLNDGRPVTIRLDAETAMRVEELRARFRPIPTIQETVLRLIIAGLDSDNRRAKCTD